MRKVKIPKGGKGYRLIYIPNEREMRKLRRLAGALRTISLARCNLSVVHGFLPGRNPVTNASAHIGYKHTLSMDLKDFFESCTMDKYEHPMVKEIGLTPATFEYAMVDGAARQGLPTSPHMSNIAAIPLDHSLSNLIECLQERVAYTRYADDLTFSCNDKHTLECVKAAVIDIAEGLGFTINKRKTKMYHASCGRRKVTGLSVGDKDVRPTRKMRRKYRSASHQRRLAKPGSGHLPVRQMKQWKQSEIVAKHRGLCEAMKCKRPNNGTPLDKMRELAGHASAEYHAMIEQALA